MKISRRAFSGGAITLALSSSLPTRAFAQATPALTAAIAAIRAYGEAQLVFNRLPGMTLGLGTPDGRRTVLSLVATDRPGLLADVSRVLRGQRLRVHDARIATFGERAEDVFLISDEHDRPLAGDTPRQALRDALQACLEGEAHA